MTPALRAAFDQEVTRARDCVARGELDTAFAHLQRAHIIGQAFVLPHAKAHWLMLKVELRRGRAAAVLGQAVRIALGMLGSAAGIVPAGNTGSTDVSMFKVMPVEPDLRKIIDDASSPTPQPIPAARDRH